MNRQILQEKLDNIRTEFMQNDTKDTILLYDFEDNSYIEDIEKILKSNKIKFISKRNQIKIKFKGEK